MSSAPEVPDPNSESENTPSSFEVPTPTEPANAADESTRMYSNPPFPEDPGALDEGLPRKSLGKYQILKLLGRGGMGVVWQAFDPGLRRTVALKVLGDHLLHSATAKRRFLREARAAAAVSHPHVLTIHSVEEHDGVPFLVMEYISGTSLRDYVRDRGTLAPLEVIRLGEQIARGLAAAHAQGVIHRDVKPGNVMLDEGATCARLADFGLARAAFDNAELTSQGHNVGTPSYISPESLRGEKIDARSDLFSLGCVYYMMLTGHSPFSGRSQAEILHNILETQPPRLHQVDPAIPEVLSEIVHQLLQKSPDQRIQSAAEVADVLSRLLQQINQAPSDEIPSILARATTSGRLPRRRVSWPGPLQAGAVLLGVAGALFLVRPDWFGFDTRPRAPLAGPTVSSAVTAPDVTAPETVASQWKLDQITVGPGPEANFASIAEALAHARAGATINVIGPGPYTDAVLLKGKELDGIQLIARPRAVWKSPPAQGQPTAGLLDVTGIVIRGFDFEVDQATGRAVQMEGDARDITLEDCTFRHMLARHSLSLVSVATAPQDAVSVVKIRQCRFRAAEGPVMCLSLGSGQSAARVVCSECLFEGPNMLIYVTHACRELKLTHNVFLGGSEGVNVSYQKWPPGTRLEVINNTFVKTRYWMGLMDSFRAGSVPDDSRTSRVCNNLILGGHRLKGGDDQWGHVLAAWTFASNWWEPDAATKSDADRGGKVATFQDPLAIPQREDPKQPDFLLPDDGSPVLNSGVGGDLPKYIGARGPRR